MDWQTVNYSIERLKNPSAEPFFIACGLHKPHLPFTVPRKYYEQFPLETIQLPPYKKDDLDDIPAGGKKMAKAAQDHARFVRDGNWKHAIQSYLATVAYTDMNIGRLLDAFDRSPQRDNTIVVYNYKEELAELRRRYPHAVTIDDPDAIARWNAGKVELLLIHPKSAGHGLNLQYGGNKMVLMSIPWSLELYEQVVGRLHRGGQTAPVWVYVLLCNKTIDERIWAGLYDKRAISDMALDELKGPKE